MSDPILLTVSGALRAASTNRQLLAEAALEDAPQAVAFLIGRPQCGEEFGTDGIHLRLLDSVFQFQFRQAVPRRLHQSLVKLHLRLLEYHQPGGDRSFAPILLELQVEKRRILKSAAVFQLLEIPASHRRTPLVGGLRQPFQP